MSSPIVIAGGGPAGLMLACELGLAGVPAIVIEPLREPSIRSPGMAINPGCVEMLDQRGLAEAVSENAIQFPAAHFSLIWLDLSRQAERHADAFIVSQSWVEQVLEKRAADLDTDIRRGHEVRGIEQDDTGVTVAVRSGDGDYQLRCSYLVGCDGAGSTVRSLARISFAGTEDPGCRGITGDVKVNFEDMTPGHLGASVSGTGSIYTGAPMGPGVLRAITIEYSMPPAGAEPVTADEFRASVRRVTGAELKGEPLWLARFGDAVKQASHYREGRVFLAGDAAHVLFPVNGLGMSTAIQDAVNLGWKLAADVHGWAPPGLLDTYHDERHPVAAQACRDVRAQAELLRWAERAAPLRDLIGDLLQFDDVQRHLIGIVTGVAARYPFAARQPDAVPHPLLGRRLPESRLVTADGELTAAGALRAGHGVLLRLSRGAAEPGDISGWMDRVDVIAAEPTPDVAATAVLLRPDGHVAWAGTAGGGDTGLREALATWFGEPAGDAH